MGLPDHFSLRPAFKYPHGTNNLITDVPGVLVGHVTHKKGDVNTGVTAVLPHAGRIFQNKVMAAAEVINGFGKSIGLIQIRELGTIETPIVLTNTLSVGTAFTGLCRYMLAQEPDIGVNTGTVNCVVTECNDGYLSDIRGLHISESDVETAIGRADTLFEEGAVGGGTGMCCLGLKGGIGSASRVIRADGRDYTLGALVMANFGAPGNLVIGGKHFNTRDALIPKDKGSIIMIIATDLPLSERQLGRVCRRTPVALARTGSYLGNGSGDIAIAFTTANIIPHEPSADILPVRMLHDEAIDTVFEATAEVVEESILSALYHAETLIGRAGHSRMGLTEYLNRLSHTEE